MDKDIAIERMFGNPANSFAQALKSQSARLSRLLCCTVQIFACREGHGRGYVTLFSHVRIA
jgi:hypothetical protein